jgi:hypothetical protein
MLQYALCPCGVILVTMRGNPSNNIHAHGSSSLRGLFYTDHMVAVWVV